ncbi:GNAT family N-acetyltransferase [Sessilibacter corallicola]|uniref:GNAT family N-acetyltransferase n=1 Tax=Sessilibacter corallicola TaxID=2904075 RepID=A0ABQ0ADF2_9GAMM
MEFRLGTLENTDVQQLLNEHLLDMEKTSPPESRHALNLDGLKACDVTFWSLWNDGRVLGFGALKELSESHGEIKSMRTQSNARGQGLGAKILEFLIAQAKLRHYTTLSLETGSMDFFKPAHRLYERFGFEVCAPFGSYTEDPNSQFYTLKL